MTHQDGWNKARPLDDYIKACKAKGMTWGQSLLHLTFLDMEQSAYGDWRLFVDDDGNYWSHYMSIGD